MDKKSKVLIIKVGYSETLDPEISSITSYGDVLRTTVLLHLYKDDHVTWLVDEKAYPILKGNPYIDRILIYNVSSVLQLQAEHFDTIINLEKVPGLCALTDSVRAWRRFGFRFDERSGCAEAYDGTQEVLAVCLDLERKRNYSSQWQEGLYKMVNAKWRVEEYVLGRKSDAPVTTDIGFNHQVGNKWSTKAWPMERWKEPIQSLGSAYSGIATSAPGMVGKTRNSPPIPNTCPRSFVPATSKFIFPPPYMLKVMLPIAPLSYRTDTAAFLTLPRSTFSRKNMNSTSSSIVTVAQSSAISPPRLRIMSMECVPWNQWKVEAI